VSKVMAISLMVIQEIHQEVTKHLPADMMLIRGQVEIKDQNIFFPITILSMTLPAMCENIQ